MLEDFEHLFKIYFRELSENIHEIFYCDNGKLLLINSKGPSILLGAILKF
jgi:hypothetical protein